MGWIDKHRCDITKQCQLPTESPDGSGLALGLIWECDTCGQHWHVVQNIQYGTEGWYLAGVRWVKYNG